MPCCYTVVLNAALLNYRSSCRVAVRLLRASVVGACRYLRDVRGQLQLRSLASGTLQQEFELPGVGNVTGISGTAGAAACARTAALHEPRRGTGGWDGGSRLHPWRLTKPPARSMSSHWVGLATPMSFGWPGRVHSYVWVQFKFHSKSQGCCSGHMTCLRPA